MGLNTNTGSGGGDMVFLNPININEAGDVRWARRVAAGVEGAVERDAKCGLVHELYYESVTGFIKSVRIVDKGQFGEDIEIALKDTDEGSELTFILQTGFSGDIGKAFIQRMQNMNPDEDITIGVCTMNGKRYCYATQVGEKIENAYKKDNPDGNNLPEPIKSEGRGGKISWDWKDHEDALFKVAEGIAEDNGWVGGDDNFTESFYKQHKDDSETPTPEAPSAPEEFDDDEPF